MKNPTKKLKTLLRLERGIMTCYEGVDIWFLPRTKTFHRDQGPAVIHLNGTLEYYCMGKRHRLDGPAFIIPSSGVERYWINGYPVEKSDF